MIKNTSKTDAVTVKITTLPPTQPKELTPKEQSEFKAQEKIIEDNYDSSFALAAALHTIKINNLYRAKYDTFANYMEERWNYSRSYGQRLLKVNEVMTDLQKVPEAKSAFPSNEGQVRIYANLKTNERHVLLKKALAECDEEAPTTKQLVVWKEELFPEKYTSKPKTIIVEAQGKFKSTLNGKRLVKQYNKVKEIYEMCVENGDEDELTELLKRFVDEYKPLLDPEAVKEVEADKTAKEGA